MLAEAEAEQGIEPAVRAIERELVMVAVRVGQESGRLEGHPGDRIGFGEIERQTDRVGARFGRRGTEAVDVAVAERVGDSRLRDALRLAGVLCRSTSQTFVAN